MSPLDRDRWQAVSPLLDRAIEMSTEELAVWLAALRTEQPALAADLEVLLADRDAIGREGFLDAGAPLTPTLAALGAGSSGSAGEQSSSAMHRSSGVHMLENFGPFRLIRLLGEGGMGIVYLAEQTEPIRREVALKVIKPGLDSAKVLARFAAERQTLANLNHSGISKIYDAGVGSEGRPYVAMEYVPGWPLTEFADEQRLPVRERLELFLQVCAAIQHAHQKGVIHRDIKPSNLLVSIVDGRPLVKVIDFGIAKALQPGPDEPLLTQTGATLGTPEYMSPEQVSPMAVDVDTRSDVYALGVVLYELLAGARPFEARDLPRPTPFALLETVRDKEPPKLITRLLGTHGTPDELAALRGTDLKRLVRQLAGELEWITLRALEKQPSRRYASAAELAADVERHLKGEPVLAGPPSTLYRLRKLARRHRVAVAALAVVAVAITAGGVVSTLALLRAVRAEGLAREELRESLLNQARTVTNSSELDRRARALTALKGAAAIRPDLDLRNAAIAALATPGFHVLRRWEVSSASAFAWPDTRLKRYVIGNLDGTVSIGSIDDSVGLLRLPRVGASAHADFDLFSPDNEWLAVLYRDLTLGVWNLSSRTEHRVATSVRAFRFTRNSSRLITLDAEDQVTLFDLKPGRETSRIRVGSSMDNLAVHPSEPLFLLSGYGRREIQIRSTVDGALARKLDVPDMGFAAQWSADGRSLITSHLDFSVRVWDWPSMDAPRLVLRFHRAEPRYIATDPSGRWLATSGWDNRIAFFDLHDGRLLLSQPGQTVHAAADRSAFLLCNRSETSLIEFEPAYAPETIAVEEKEKGPRAVTFSPSGRWLATSGPGGVRVVDLRSRELHSVMDDEPSIDVAFSADSRRLHAITWTHFRAWRIEANSSTSGFNTEPAELPGTGDRVDQEPSVGGISADGEEWLAVRKDPRAGAAGWIHGRFDSAEIGTVEGHTTGSSGPEFSPDGRWVAWGNWHGSNAGVTPLDTNGPPVKLSTAGNTSVAFSPDSRILAVGDPEELRFCESGTWRPLRSIPRRPINPAPPRFAFTHDSRICAVAVPPDRVILVETATGRELGTLSADPHTTGKLAFSPDGRFLAVASFDHLVLLWDIGELRRRLREIGLDWELSAEKSR